MALFFYLVRSESVVVMDFDVCVVLLYCRLYIGGMGRPSSKALGAQIFSLDEESGSRYVAVDYSVLLV
jgi:hypothetical protein